MKEQQSQDKSNPAFKSVPIVRLDSGAVRIPIEFIENMTVPRGNGKPLRISVKNGSFWAWR